MKHRICWSQPGMGTRPEEIAAMLAERFRCGICRPSPGPRKWRKPETTFAENARLKALGISAVVPGPGAGGRLGAGSGRPARCAGSHSARYAGEDARHGGQQREADAGDGRGRESHRAVSLRDGALPRRRGAGRVRRIGGRPHRRRPAAAGGFGYDPFFVPDGHDQTFAELGCGVKNTLSHRARALEKLVAWLDAG